jgi:small subunit ribosomal protein S6
VNTYETLFIVNPEIGDGEITKTIEMVQDIVTSGGGTILKVDKWGKRQLAYEIQKKREGFYVLLYFQAEADVLVELNRRFKLTDAIMRNMVLVMGKEQLVDLQQSIESETALDTQEAPEETEEQEAAEDAEEEKPVTETEGE